MHLPRLLLASLLCFALGPAVAQDGGEDESGIEVSEDPDPGEEAPARPDGEDEEAETRKKNVGLAGGGEGQDDDPNAPKVKADLQTRINEAIARGVKALKKLQDKDGSWGPVRANSRYDDPKARGDFVRDELGPTAWAVYTLAKCGVKKSDRSIQRGLDWIAKNTEFVRDVQGGEVPARDDSTKQTLVDRSHPRELTTYESAAIVLMIEAVFEGSAKLGGKHSKRRLYTDNELSPPVGSKIQEDWWKRMHDRVLHLTVGRTLKVQTARSSKPGKQTLPGTQNPEQQEKANPNAGGWRYQWATGDADLSSSQFVLLALRAASQAGYPVDKVAPNTFAAAAKYARRCQKGDGGFGYQVGGGPSYGSMTACAVGSLLICKEQLELVGKKAPDGTDAAIQSGMEWLDKNFDATTNTGADRPELFYYLYGVERVGDLAGRKEFAGKDWYVRGALHLLERQEEDGKWQDATGYQPHDVLGTCFALLFLKRATPPVVTFSGPEKGE
jgi:hypothetical protein